MTEIRTFDSAIVQPEQIGRFASGCVVAESGVVRDTLLSPCLYHNVDLRIRDSEVVTESCDALFIGCFYNCWGHSLTDSLRYLWVFLPRYRKMLVEAAGNAKIVYVTAGGECGRKFGKNFAEMLDVLGVPRERIIEIRKPTRFRRLFVPTPSFYEDEKIDRHCTDKYKETIDYIIDAVVPRSAAPDKIVYFTRSKWQHGFARKDFGEIAIERAVKRAYPDCEMVAPETLSFKELVKLVASCKMLITTEGSIGHNSLFLRGGGNIRCVIEMLATESISAGDQRGQGIRGGIAQGALGESSRQSAAESCRRSVLPLRHPRNRRVSRLPSKFLAQGTHTVRTPFRLASRANARRKGV